MYKQPCRRYLLAQNTVKKEIEFRPNLPCLCHAPFTFASILCCSVVSWLRKFNGVWQKLFYFFPLIQCVGARVKEMSKDAIKHCFCAVGQSRKIMNAKATSLKLNIVT